MKVSIVVASRNGAPTLGDALAGLTAQRWDGGPWEILLADNGSSDATAAIFEEQARRHPEIPMRRIDAGARRGKSYALNRGLEAAQGEWLLFCDDDDVPAEGWLAAMAEALAADEAVAGYIDFDRLNEPWVLAAYRLPPGKLRGPREVAVLPGCRVAGGATLGVRRSVFERVGTFDETILAHEDHDFCFRLHRAGLTIRAVPGARMHVRLRSDPGAMYLQAHKYARGGAMLRSRYVPRPRFGTRKWLELAGDLARALATRALIGLGRPADRVQRAQLSRRLGTVTGDLVGSLVYRVPPLRRRGDQGPTGGLLALHDGADG